MTRSHQLSFFDNKSIAYCNHCNYDITLEDKSKLRWIVVRTDNDEVVDVSQLFYGFDQDTNEVLVSELPDALEAYYGGREPKLKGSFAQMFGPGSTRTLLSYTASDPIHGTTYKYTKGSGDYGISGRDRNRDDDNYITSTNYGKGKTNIHVREEKSSKTNTNTKAEGKASRSPKPHYSDKSSTGSFINSHKSYMKVSGEKGE
jgi:hypothetical protein